MGYADDGSVGVDDWIVVGKLIIDKNLNKAGVMAILRNIWPEKEAPAIGEVGMNTYSISFSSQEVMMKALEGNPWSIMGYCLNLKKWSANTPVAQLDFKGIQFWIQIHNLPRELLTKQNGEKIRKMLGEVLKVEEPRGRFALNRGFLQLRIIVDSEKPLTPGFWFPSQDGEKRWADIKKFGPKMRTNSLRQLEYGDEVLSHKETQAESLRKGKAIDHTMARVAHMGKARETHPLSIRGTQPPPTREERGQHAWNVILDSRAPKRGGRPKSTPSSPESNIEKGQRELTPPYYVDHGESPPLIVKSAAPVFSPSKVLKAVLNLSSVFRRLNLKRIEKEEMENNRAIKKARCSVVIEEMANEQEQIVTMQNAFDEGWVSTGTKLKQGRKTIAKRRKCRARRELVEFNEMSLVEEWST
ncbi:hypothetical protein COLO4_25222 [Corchorus olitorius]|uniref:DUF4283 domain-containing protein n=1 Tax=Corchorus olitorius TaxID=93759 RepID=A0A1R3I474_9ROSI|nr:hypothetical protein COLO4_25222 [Corchorus olitorius]